MQIDDFLELVTKRRNVRRFKTEPIPDEYIRKILEAARWAMSGANAQPWEFIVVKNPDTKAKLAEAIHEQRKMEYAMELMRIDRVRHAGLAAFKDSRPAFNEAPVVIAVCGDRRTLAASVYFQNFDPGEGGLGGTFIKNMANATQIIHLAAAAAGLASNWVSVGRSVEGMIREAMGVPAILEVHTLVPIGYPLHRPAPVYRRPLDDIVHYEKYDMSKFRSTDDIVEYLAELKTRIESNFRKEA
jgi:nitroreductase